MLFIVRKYHVARAITRRNTYKRRFGIGKRVFLAWFVTAYKYFIIAEIAIKQVFFIGRLYRHVRMVAFLACCFRAFFFVSDSLGVVTQRAFLIDWQYANIAAAV